MTESALEKNKTTCPCPGYRPKIDKCCERVAKHRVKSKFPAYLFTKEGEKTSLPLFGVV